MRIVPNSTNYVAYYTDSSEPDDMMTITLPIIGWLYDETNPDTVPVALVPTFDGKAVRCDALKGIVEGELKFEGIGHEHTWHNHGEDSDNVDDGLNDAFPI